MKRSVYLLGCLLIWSCGNQPKPQVKRAEPDKISDRWLEFPGTDPSAAHIVLISGDEEYRSEEALPQLARILSERHGFACTVLFAQDPANPGIINPNYVKNIFGLEALEKADLMVIFTRFRALPDDQMRHIDAYLRKGKPVIGIRTATHAFNFDPDTPSEYAYYSFNYDGDKEAWKDGFGRLVLGETWINHHGNHKHQSTRGIIATGAASHPITNGISDGDVWGPTDVYGVRLPLPGDSKPIIYGQVMERNGDFDGNDIFYGMKPEDDVPATTNDDGLELNNPMMPVAWIKSYQLPGGKTGNAFTSTIGSSSDLLREGTRRLLVNAVFWALNKEVPARANVELVEPYQPTRFEFRDEDYWKNKQLRIPYFK